VQHRGAVEPGHEQVEDDQVVLALERLEEPLGAGIGRVRLVPLDLEPADDESQDPLLVVDDQNPGQRRRSCAFVRFSQHGQLLGVSVGAQPVADQDRPAA
jgi:hypothetical protein